MRRQYKVIKSQKYFELLKLFMKYIWIGNHLEYIAGQVSDGVEDTNENADR